MILTVFFQAEVFTKWHYDNTYYDFTYNDNASSRAI
jgi:hypothetical protein